MPTATDELREEMRKRFGDGIDCVLPLKYLIDRGFTEKAGMIRPPKQGYMVSKEEWACVEFLFQEWDFGYMGG